jgi:hypothetical protein
VRKKTDCNIESQVEWRVRLTSFDITQSIRESRPGDLNRYIKVIEERMMKADMLAALGMSKPRIRRKKGGGSKGLRRAGGSSSSSSSSNSKSSSSEVYSDSETSQDDGEQAGRSRGNSSMHPRVSTPSNRRPPMAAAAAAALASRGSEGRHDQWDRGDDEPQNVESISSSPIHVQPPVAKGSVTLSLAQMKEMCRGR